MILSVLLAKFGTRSIILAQYLKPERSFLHFWAGCRASETGIHGMLRSGLSVTMMRRHVGGFLLDGLPLFRE